jgi:uncharacterized protein
MESDSPKRNFQTQEYLKHGKEIFMKAMDKDEIIRLTEEYGGAWGINHTRRLLQLIAIIGEGQSYDADVVWVAAHLHDWGGYTKWKQAGVDHALRSRQVAEEFLAERGYSPERMTAALECIEYHHGSDPHRRLEALLLSDADALDFLGTVGVLRDFSKQPGDLRKAYETVCGRKEKLRRSICLPRAKAIAAGRLEKTERLLAAFEEETFGYF